MHALTDLAAVLEEEVGVGEELLRNLAAQREAILSWDSSPLLERVEEKEVLIRRLGAMEERRQEIMAHLCCSPGATPSLKELLAQLPPGAQREFTVDSLQSPLHRQPSTVNREQDRPFDSAQDRLGYLQHRAWGIYSRLRAEEKRLVSLMENLLGHLREALSPLSHPPVHLYGKKGTPAHPRPESGLVQGKI